MTWKAELRGVHRSAIALMLALSRTTRGATYRGIAALLGLGSYSATRETVRRAESAGLVRVVNTGRGPGAVAVVVLTEKALELLRQMGNREC